MPTYQYSAMDAQGKERKGRVEAENDQIANTKLKEQGLFPTNITEVKGGGKSGGKKKGKKKLKGSGLVIGTPKLKTRTTAITATPCRRSPGSLRAPPAGSTCSKTLTTFSAIDRFGVGCATPP